jgi:hypothetical protein
MVTKNRKDLIIDLNDSGFSRSNIKIDETALLLIEVRHNLFFLQP